MMARPLVEALASRQRSATWDDAKWGNGESCHQL